MTEALVIAALAVILAAVVYSAIRDHNASEKEINSLKLKLEAQKKISAELAQYAKEIAKIKSDKEDVAEQIDEAKNDEEVLSIIAGLVSANNDRVRK